MDTFQEYLVQCGALVDDVNDLGNPLLYHALVMGKDDVVEALLRHGASDTIKNKFGQTAQDLVHVCKIEAWYDAIKSRVALQKQQKDARHAQSTDC